MPRDPDPPSRDQVGQEKRAVAASSVLAAVVLTSMKIVVGILTGSLGILSEAAHSGLDLVAAGMTWLAVRLSDQPPDEVHTYGHGKVENLSALFEAVLLLATCAWIIYEAIQRLFFKSVDIEASLWGFIVMGISILIDLSRSRALARVAKKHHSQALEADALHFSTDVWSSTVVIAGLAMVRLAEWLQIEWLVKADAIAALGVAAIVVHVSLQLGQRTVAALLDAAPSGMKDSVIQAVQIPGVLEVKQARLRQSGAETFADLTLTVEPGTSVERAHDIASAAEAKVQDLIPGADVVVHLEPTDHALDSVVDTVRLLAARQGLGAHSIRLRDIPGRRSLELHLEVADSLSLDDAHAQATRFEAAVVETLPEIDQVVTHLEPSGDDYAVRAAAPADQATVMEVLESVVQELGLACSVHQVEVHRERGELGLSFHCELRGSYTIAEAHDLSERLERQLRVRLPALARVVIHVEPPQSEAGPPAGPPA